MIVRFNHWRDKFSILSQTNIRDRLRDRGIKVANDMTRAQSQIVAAARRNGERVYFKGGKLCVVPVAKPVDLTNPNSHVGHTKPLHVNSYAQAVSRPRPCNAGHVSGNAYAHPSPHQSPISCDGRRWQEKAGYCAVLPLPPPPTQDQETSFKQH